MISKPNKSLLGQFYQRKVMRVGFAYVLIGWIMMQVGEVTFEALSLPPWSLTFLITLVVLGFPIALVLAWAYEVTPEGIVKDPVGSADAPDLVRDATSHSAPSVAVLPFDDMSEHGDQVYFCEGIAEEILISLCNVAGLRVASRVASFRFGGKRADIVEIGKQLKVKAVLEGSVRQFGEHLRITAQLINVADGYHLWSHQYDRQREDLFDVQEDIAGNIADALSATLKHSHLDEQKQVDPRAYDFFLRGKYYFAKCNAVDAVHTRQMFTHALKVDPGYGRAWAWLAYSYGFEYMFLNGTEANRDAALRTSEKALKLAPELAESQIAAGIACCMIGKCQKAEARFKKAIELDPKRFEAWYFYGRTMIREGHPKQALKLFQQAARIRPEDYQCVLLQAQLHMALGDTKRALEASRKGVERARTVLEFNPDDNRALNLGALALLRLSEDKEAADWMKASVKKAPRDPIVLYNAACFYAMLGKSRKALESLEKCVLKVGGINREWLENDSDLDNIRDHPRYANLMASISETESRLKPLLQ